MISFSGPVSGECLILNMKASVISQLVIISNLQCSENISSVTSTGRLADHSGLNECFETCSQICFPGSQILWVDSREA